jgi:hypothetical protein|tara:strand:+ start:4161 stop:4487 length:327 start_codon:yes stop_codon:yes gene_type:complete
MRILDFKKGQEVPGWIAAVNSKHLFLTFDYDTRVTKTGPHVAIHIFEEEAIEGEMLAPFYLDDKRPGWLKLLHKITFKKHQVDMSAIKCWSTGEFNYDDPFGMQRRKQ